MSSIANLPYTERHVFDDPPERGAGNQDMEFRLTYKGRLPAASRAQPRAADKHRIRRELHPQLQELWKQHPILKDKLERRTGGRPNVELIAERFVRGSHGQYRFVPLIMEEYLHSCSLDILFLRRDGPGNIVRSGGDLDNRIKVLFDALTVPNDNAKAGLDGEPDPEESPFYCLLEDDKLITEFSVTTDRLLQPLAPDEGEREQYVHLIIHVKTAPFDIRGTFSL